MMKLLVIPFLLLMISSVSAQSGRPDPGCARDVSRYCRSRINDGDMVILACLKEHRARLSKACAKALTDNGQ